MPVSFENRNFQKELEKKLQELQQQDVKHLLLHSCCAPCSSYVIDKKLELIKKEEKVPTLLLHSCCAPCSSYVIEYLSDYFNITVFYYNPNISQDEEYCKRVHEQQRFIKEFPAKYPVSFIEGDYEPQKFFENVRGYEKCREGGERCFICYRMRLEKTAQLAKQMNFDYFTTTLTISPLK